MENDEDMEPQSANISEPKQRSKTVDKDCRRQMRAVKKLIRNNMIDLTREVLTVLAAGD